VTQACVVRPLTVARPAKHQVGPVRGVGESTGLRDLTARAASGQPAAIEATTQYFLNTELMYLTK